MEGRMRSGLALAMVGVLVLAAGDIGRGQQGSHLNPMIALHMQKKPIFGLYAPSNPRGRGNRPGGPGAAVAGSTAFNPATPPAATPAPATPPPPPVKTPAELAKDALAYAKSDFVFDGTMEGGVDRGIPAFSALVSAMAEASTPEARWKHPLSVKTPEIAPDPAKAIDNISRQLNLGVSTIVFVGVESADEVKQGLAAMRLKSKGGTRPDDVGDAPKYWGLSEKDYREKADVWPLNPNGELTNWTIVESKAGLAKVREIAAVKGISVLFPGAGTLRGVFTTTEADGTRKFDAEGWEAAIQQVLAACKEFNVQCGYPATDKDIETRIQQGFSVFIMNWGDPGFRAVEIGRRGTGR
jgi:4-hydroxy-2-oxoheptanedioate aldolase